ncbi:MAG: FkbM family methyltransferase [Parcubacteria group bacterium]
MIRRLLVRVTPKFIREFIRKVIFFIERVLSEVRFIITNFDNWFTTIFYRFGLLWSNNVVCALKDGFIFKIGNSRNARIFVLTVREILKQDIYRLSDLANLSPKIFVDIGAHFGVFSIEAAKLFPNASVYSFEPDPENFYLLKQNIKLNNLEKRVIPENFAISSRRGILKFFRNNISSLRNSLYKAPDQGDYAEVRTASITLSDAFHKNKIEHCDLLKLDCEGAEFEILLGSSRSTFLKIDRVAVEYHDHTTKYTHRDIINFLENNGFKVSHQPSRGGRGILNAVKIFK